MRKVLAFAIALGSGLVSAAAYGQAMFVGYDQLCGVRVVQYPNPQIASAGFDAQGPVIYIDPGAMQNWTASRVFTLAHECGHLQLGHSTPQGMYFRNTVYWATKEQELEADCWATQALAKLGRYQADLRRMDAQFRSQGSQPQGPYPSGLERAFNLERCLGEGGSADGMSKSSNCYTTQCVHAAHPAGDVTTCVHPAHPAGDVVRCQHPCYMPNGYAVPCHAQGDLIPCVHPAHPAGDVTACVHPAHPAGDVTCP